MEIRVLLKIILRLWGMKADMEDMVGMKNTEAMLGMKDMEIHMELKHMGVDTMGKYEMVDILDSNLFAGTFLNIPFRHQGVWSWRWA